MYFSFSGPLPVPAELLSRSPGLCKTVLISYTYIDTVDPDPFHLGEAGAGSGKLAKNREKFAYHIFFLSSNPFFYKHE